MLATLSGFIICEVNTLEVHFCMKKYFKQLLTLIIFDSCIIHVICVQGKNLNSANSFLSHSPKIITFKCLVSSQSLKISLLVQMYTLIFT